MKNILLAGLIFVLMGAYVKTIAQENIPRKELGYVKELSREEENELLKMCPLEIKNKLQEIKNMNNTRYNILLKKLSILYPDVPMRVTGLGKQTMEAIRGKSLLEVEAEICVLKYKKADNSVKPKIKSDLQSTLNKLFEVNEIQKLEEIKYLENRLIELKKSLQTRKQNKDEIVKRRVCELLDESDNLKWD